MADELRGIENGFNLLYGRTPEPDPRYDPIRQDQGYQMQLDPMLEPSLNLNGSTNPPARQMADQAQPLDEERLGALAGWSQSPDQGGLGVAGPGPAPDRQESLDEHFARQIFPGFKGELSFGDKLRLRDGMMNAIPQMASRREQVAQQAKELEEKGRQHDMQLMEKAMKDPRQLEALSNTQGFRMQKQANMLFKTMKDADYSAWPRYQKTLEAISPGVTKRFADGEVDYYELNSLMEVARDSEKVNWKEQAKTAALNQALATPEAERNPFQKSLVNDKDLAQKKIQSEINENNAQASRANREALNGPPDHSEDNRIHEALNGGLPWARGSDQTRQAALKYKAEQYAQGKANVTAGTSLSQLGKQQEFRDPVTGKASPGWATTEQANKMGFVNIETSQIPTVNQLQNVDAALKEILAAGSTLVRNETGHGLFDIPTGMLQTPLVKLTTKFAGDPNAQLLMSAITRITPAMSKLGGDTGNVAVEERKMYADSLFDPADTLGSFVAKIKSVKKATDRTREAMGFVPDDNAYMRRLAIMGHTDDQIKAIMQERKRMQ